jgi:hypothetical protein
LSSIDATTFDLKLPTLARGWGGEGEGGGKEGEMTQRLFAHMNKIK